jgi:hypothetical protein
MRLYFLLLLTSFFHFAYTQSRTQIADRKIKSLIQQIHDERRNVSQDKLIESKFDKKGNVVELIEYSQDKTILKWEKHTYNNKNQETGTQILDAQGKQISRIEIVFDKLGTKTLELFYLANDSLDEKNVFEYNAFSDKIAEINYDGKGIIKSKTIYAYDNKGLIKQKTILNADNKVIYSRIYTYEY